MLKLTVIGLVVAAYSFVGSGSDLLAAGSTQHYPKLIRAEMPLYPSVALTAKISGSVVMLVTVERGFVIDVYLKSSSSPHLANPAIANVKT